MSYYKTVFKAIHLIQLRLVKVLSGADEDQIDNNQFEKIIREILFKLSFQEINETGPDEVKFSRAFRDMAVYLGSGFNDRSKSIGQQHTQKHRSNKLSPLKQDDYERVEKIRTLRPDSGYSPEFEHASNQVTTKKHRAANQYQDRQLEHGQVLSTLKQRKKQSVDSTIAYNSDALRTQNRFLVQKQLYQQQNHNTELSEQNLLQFQRTQAAQVIAQQQQLYSNRNTRNAPYQESSNSVHPAQDPLIERPQLNQFDSNERSDEKRSRGTSRIRNRPITLTYNQVDVGVTGEVLVFPEHVVQIGVSGNSLIRKHFLKKTVNNDLSPPRVERSESAIKN